MVVGSERNWFSRRNKTLWLAGVLLILPLVTVSVIVGPFSPRNHAKHWKAAFGQPLPDQVDVVNSHFVRTYHWTYEFECFFELRPDEEVQRQIISAWRLRRLEEFTTGTFFGETPRWFLPEAPYRYETWVTPDYPADNLRVSIDSKTGQIYITHYQT